MLPGPPQGAHYRVHSIYLLPQLGIKKGLIILRVKPTLTGFPTNSLHTPMDNTPLHSISNVCHTLVVLTCLEYVRQEGEETS